MIVYLPILTLARGGGEVVPSDGPDGGLRPGGVDGPVDDADAGARLARPAASDCRRRRRSSIASPTGLFQPLLRLVCLPDGPTLVAVGAVTVAATLLGLTLGSEFVPKLGEGTIVINTVRLASVSLEESLRLRDGRSSRSSSENSPTRWHDDLEPDRDGRGGHRPDGPGDHRRVHLLRPRDRWKRAKTQEELVEEMSEVTEKLPGMRAVYSQPIEERINEMVAGIRADLGIKIFGDDLESTQGLAAEVSRRS